MVHSQHLSTEMQRCSISCDRGLGKRSKRQPIFMETKTIPNTGLVQTPMKEQSPRNSAHILNRDPNLTTSVFGVDVKTRFMSNQDL